MVTTTSRLEGLTEPERMPASGQWASAGHYDPGFVDRVMSELDELAALKPNWDGYGAPCINPAIIAAAGKFIQDLPPHLAYRPCVTPMSPGNLQFEWHHQGKVLELEFETADKIHFLQWHPEADLEEEAIFPARDLERAIDLIQWFMSGTCV